MDWNLRIVPRLHHPIHVLDSFYVNFYLEEHSYQHFLGGTPRYVYEESCDVYFINDEFKLVCDDTTLIDVSIEDAYMIKAFDTSNCIVLPTEFPIEIRERIDNMIFDFRMKS